MTRALALAGVVLTTAACHEDRSIVVPDVVGEPSPVAEARLDELGLRWRFGGSEKIDTVPFRQPTNGFIAPDPFEDPVVRQYPPPGAAVARGHVIELETRCTMLRFRNSACY